MRYLSPFTARYKETLVINVGAGPMRGRGGEELLVELDLKTLDHLVPPLRGQRVKMSGNHDNRSLGYTTL